MDLVDVLQKLEGGAKALRPFVSGPYEKALGIVETTLRTAAMLADSGYDPLAEIQRILDVDPLLQGMRDSWEQKIKEKFGG
jgi:hypothetical protein